MLSARSISLAMACFLLVGCAAGPSVKPTGILLPSPSPTLVACFQSGLTKLPDGPYTATAARDVIVKLRASEIVKTKCGLELLKFWEDLRARLAEVGK